MIEYNLEQGSEEWHKCRLGIPTGSKFSAVMAEGNGNTRNDYVIQCALERITGEIEESYTSAAMQIGKERENDARFFYESETSNFVRQVGFCRHDVLEAGVSPDGLIENDGGIEIKCPIPKTHLKYLRLDKNECPSVYKWQIQGCMFICDTEWWDFVSYNPFFPNNASLAVRRIYRDENMINRLKNELEIFLNDVEKEFNFIKNYDPN